MKKTLTIKPVEERADAPKLQKKGRGWNIAESRLDTLHDAAREMRRSPTPAQAALAAELAKADLGRYRFKRYAVIGSAIVDFACQPLKLVVALDEGTNPPEIERRRDRSLGEVGIKVIRYPAADVLADPEGAARAVLAEMKARWHEQRASSRPNQNRHRQGAARGYQR